MAIPTFEKVLKATREQLALPKHVSAPEPTQYEHATAILTGQEIDKELEPSEECIRASERWVPTTGSRAINKPAQTFMPDTACGEQVCADCDQSQNENSFH